MASPNLQEAVLNYLLRHPWSAPLELQKALQSDWRKQGTMGFTSRLLSLCGASMLSEIFQRPGIGELYVVLARLEKAHLLESRWRDEPLESLRERGGHRRREYNFTRP